MFNNPFDSMFTIAPMFISAIFVLVIGTVIFIFVKGIGQWRYNNSQPVLTVPAKITSKRTNVSSSMQGDGGDATLHHSHMHTTYFVAFEVESGDRMEFVVNGREFGRLADNDFGKLTFQGTRFLEFVRDMSQY